jgi:hypothetical protein
MFTQQHFQGSIPFLRGSKREQKNQRNLTTYPEILLKSYSSEFNLKIFLLIQNGSDLK